MEITPEMAADLIRLKEEGKVTPEQQYVIRRLLLGKQAGMEDSPAGYAAFYELVHGIPPPAHVMEYFIKPIYAAKQEDKGALIWAFRGSWKTTSITITFTAFQIGHHPERANLIIQVNDASAKNNTSLVADMIEMNEGWKLAFPHIVPDKQKGWGAEGYEVKRADMAYDVWREHNSARKDPSFVGWGYKSGAIIGMHPDGVLIVDDIQDEDNTSSDRELQTVVRKVTGTIFPTIVEDESRPPGERMVTTNVFVGTPWTEDDIYHFIKETGEFHFTETPVMREAAPGNGGTRISHVELEGEYELVWPERMNVDSIISLRKKTGAREFARMYLLDLERADVTGIKHFPYPSQHIQPAWITVGGVDYASVISDAHRTDKNRSYFALCYAMKVPTGGVVVFDGVFERCTQAEGEAYVERAQGLFPGWQYAVVEGDGKGEEFIAVLMRKPHLRIMPMKTRGQGKKERLERQMAPWLENGTVRVSDANTPFLDQLRKALRQYPNGNLDVLDSLYWALRGMPEVLAVRAEPETLPRVKREKPRNPFLALGRV